MDVRVSEACYSEEDAQGCFAVQRDAWRAGFVPEFFAADALGAAWEEEIRAKWSQWGMRNTPNTACLVARVGDEGGVAGYAVCGPSREPAFPALGEVWSFYVHPRHWGTGVARKLMDASLDYLAGLGMLDVIVVTFRENRRSVPFYKKCGFALDGFAEHRTYLGYTHEIVVLVRKAAAVQ